LKVNGIHQLPLYVVDINTFGGNTHTVAKNIEALLVSSKETGLEVNADKAKYMIFLVTSTQRKSQNKDR
jgi:hypothetical protein